MARKKTTEATGPEETDGPVDFSRPSRAAGMVKALFGDDVYSNGRDVYDKPREVFSTGSPSLDAALGGGLVTGTAVTLAGDSGCGKTTLALSIAAEWQALGRRVAYLSAEGRFYRLNMNIAGLDPSKIEVYQSTRGKILSCEDYLRIAETILKNETNTRVIIDSLSILVTGAELDEPNYEKSTGVASASRLVSSWCKKVTPIVPVNDNLVVGIAHVYANIGGKGKKWATSLAKKAQYFRSTAIECGWVEYLQKDGDKTAWGQRIHWQVDRSPLGAPKGKAETVLRYGRGIDKEIEYVEQAQDLGLISSRGAYYYLDFIGEDVKGIQGVDRTCQYLRDNPEHYATLRGRIAYMSGPEPDDDPLERGGSS